MQPNPSKPPSAPGRENVTVLQKLVLLGVSTLLAWLAAEWVWAKHLRPSRPPRVLFFSQNPWEFDGGGFTRFQPDAEIRVAAVYGETIEYDVTFSTNRQGFVDSEDYGPSGDGRAVQNIAVVGDSFTAGFHAGAPWVPALRAEPGFDPAEQRLFNFGVSGTGLRNFDRLLRTFGRDLAFDVILIVAITSDFDRPLWRPVTSGDKIVLCHLDWSEPECRERKTEIFVLPGGVPTEGIRELAGEKYRQRQNRPARRLRESLAAWLARKLLARAEASPRDEADALASIRAAFPEAEIRLLHLPQLEEVRSGRFRDRQDEVEARGIAYLSGWRACGLTAEDYFPNDSHPNASGYRKIKQCASRTLGLRR